MSEVKGEGPEGGGLRSEAKGEGPGFAIVDFGLSKQREDPESAEPIWKAGEQVVLWPTCSRFDLQSST